LPQCQINRIFKLLRELPQSLGIPEPIDAGPAPADAEDITPKACYFWMDTLCIPKDATLRHHAITKMSEVYSSASKVLVITAEFIQHPSINRSYMEIFTRISRSTWLRRLWTLQEATLNRELLFQFSDQAVSVNDNSARARLQERENIEMPWDLVRWECNRYHFDNFFGRQQTSYTRQENQVWQGLQHRTTSRGGDEPLCIAILLGLNVEQLQEEPDAHSVKKFWRLHEKRGVPAQVLFIPGPKLDEDGLHWALSNLMDLRIVGGDITAHADVTPRGLCAKWPGILLEPLKQPANFVIPVEVEGQIFYVRQNLISSAPSWTGLHLHERKLAIILMIVRRIGSGAIDGLESGLGAMVQVLSEGEEHHVKYLRLVSLLRKDEFADRHPNTPWKSGEIEEKLGDPAHGIFLDSRQRWCVG
jgi:hypothetical protein